MTTYYDKDDVFEFYFGMHHSTWELWSMTNPDDPQAVRALANKLVAEHGPEDDQLPPHPGELALLLAANAHAFRREFAASYGCKDTGERSFEEAECQARGWAFNL